MSKKENLLKIDYVKNPTSSGSSIVIGGGGSIDTTGFLLRDGSRAMYGNLDMGAKNINNVNLVDGVDIAAHVLNANAHHAQATGSGAINVTLGQVITLNTPGNLSDTSVNSSGTNHTHLIDSSIARSAVEVIAGSGLTGGGNLTANRTINVGAGTLITVNSDDVAIKSSDSAYQFIASGATTTPTWLNISSLAGSGLTSSSGVLNVGSGTLITVNSDDIAISASNSSYQFIASGATTTPTWLNISSLAGNGLASSSGILNVGAGTLITVNSDDVAISASNSNYQFIASGATTTPIWTNISDLAGNGLTSSSGILNVGAGDGLTVSANSIALTTPGELSATTVNNSAGNHVHAITTATAVDLSVNTTSGTGNSSGLARANHTHAIISSFNPGPSASILASDTSGFLTLVRLTTTSRVRTPLIDTASGDMNISPAVDLVLSPASNMVKLGLSASIQSNTYASQATGWRISPSGSGDFRYLYADEMHVKTFITDLEQALAGGQIITKSVAILAESFTLPAAGGFVTIKVRNLPSVGSVAVFQNDDFVGFKQITRTGTSLNVGWAWGTVKSYINQGDGTQTWTWTRSASPYQGEATGTILADTLALDFGKSGNGYYEVNAIDGYMAENSPYWRIARWETHPSLKKVMVQGGNLNGLFSVANEYGLYVGNGGTSSSDNFLRMSNVGYESRNISSSWFLSNTKVIEISPNDGIDLLSYNTGDFSTSGQSIATGYKISFTKVPGTTGILSDETAYIVGAHGTDYSRIMVGSYNASSQKSTTRLDAESGGYNPYLELTTNGTGTSSLRLISANFGIGTTNPTSQLTINSSFATTSGLTISGENADDSQIITRRAASKTAFSVLAWESQVHLGAGIYYDNGGWVHHNSNNNNQLFTLTPGGGVRWFASNNALASWDQANDVTLWDDQGDWNSLVQSTRTGNSYFTGGNLGIGTTNPSYDLVVSNGGAEGFEFIPALSSNLSIFLGYNRSTSTYTSLRTDFADYRFTIGSTERVRITSTGSVGIGTTNPIYKLVVSNNGAEGFEFIPGNSSNINVFQGYNRSTSVYTSLRTDFADYRFTIGGTERVRIDTAGNVGIGTTSPAYKLDVNGSARATSLNITGATGQIAIQDRLSSSSINLYISGGVFAFNNGTSDIFQLGNTGNVALYGALYGTNASFSGNATASNFYAGTSSYPVIGGTEISLSQANLANNNVSLLAFRTGAGINAALGYLYSPDTIPSPSVATTIPGIVLLSTTGQIDYAISLMARTNTASCHSEWLIQSGNTASKNRLYGRVSNGSTASAVGIMELTSTGFELRIGSSSTVDLSLDSTGILQIANNLRIGGDTGGVANYTTFTNQSDVAPNSTGTGTIKMKGLTNRDSAGFIKIYIGATVYWVPVFTAVS